jgi:hypothetical protein
MAGLVFFGRDPEQQSSLAIAFLAKYLEVIVATVQHLPELGRDNGNLNPFFVGQGAKRVGVKTEGVEGEEFICHSPILEGKTARRQGFRRILRLHRAVLPLPDHRFLS